MSFIPTPLNLPAYPFRIKEEGGKYFIFDEIRKKFLQLTPEEWVRQHVVHYLVQHKKYPKSLIQIEGGLKLNTLQKRSDILIYNTQGTKCLLVECKSPFVKINQAVFEQITRYNSVHRAPSLLVSNGLTHYYWQVDFAQKKYQFKQEIPDYCSHFGS